MRTRPIYYTNVLVLFVSFIILQSCVMNQVRLVKIDSEFEKPIGKIDYFSPFSSISVIKSKNELEINDSLSILSIDLCAQALENAHHLNIDSQILIDDEILNSKIQNQLYNYIVYAHNNQDINEIKMSSDIILMMESNRSDYAISTLFSGFSRTAKNQKKQIGKAIGLGILTLGSFTQIPTKSNLTVFLMLFDRKNQKVTLYQEAITEGKDPMELETITKLIDKALYKYLN